MELEQALEGLLLRIFTAEELRRNLRHLPTGDALLAELPGREAPPRALVSECVAALGRRGWAAAAPFWAMLRRERPRFAAEIAKLEAGLAASDPSDPSEAAGDGVVEPGRGERLRILFVSASPEAEERLRCDQELRRIMERLRGARFGAQISVIHAPAARYEDLRTALLEHRPHALHLSCHGTADGGLVLEGSHGGAETAPPQSLRLLLELADELRLVVLAACHSVALARRLTHPQLRVAMDSAIPDFAACSFSVAFYETLAFGRSVEAAFQAGIADLARYGGEAAPKLLPEGLEGAAARATPLVGRR
jgi:hypothetical protein